MTTYYHVDPSTTRGDTSGRYPGNHVRYPGFLAPVGWVYAAKKALTGTGAFKLRDPMLKAFDKPRPLHPRWGTAQELNALRDCVAMFADGIDNNPHISPIGRLLLRTVFVAHLKNRSSFIKFFEANADFITAHGKYKAPLIVTGFPRTGTTLLHRLMAEDPRSRSPFTFEMEKVLPPLKRGDDPMRDPRIRKSNASMSVLTRLAPGFIEKFNESHLWSATEKEESLVYMHFHNGMTTVNNFQAGFEYMMRSVLPDVAPALLKYERNFFTMLDAFAPAQSHWINKAPSYAFYFAQLFEAFDDARIVLTHRNPAKNAPSVTRLMESANIPFDVEGSFDKHAFGRMSTDFWGETWSRPLAYRTAHPEREGQIIDAVYRDIFADPIGTVRRIYDKFDLEVTPEFEARMQAYLAENQQGKYGRHRYSNAEYAIDTDALKARYKAYFDRYHFQTIPAEGD
ncbi:sulfotransferase family protein [Sulfitobacter sp. JB4-11]|uniref:sulfotransferase family protein n=1 Tax=Sulfitobacter rhodophyticola TaxID=3238304 RepID=UPI0035164AE2